MEVVPDPETNALTPRQWAAHMGWASAGQAYAAIKANRVVMAPDGKRLLVAESTARYHATADPAKAGVTARHAAQRAAGRLGDEGISNESASSAEQESASSYDFHSSKAKREHFAALDAEAAYRARMRELLEASEVRAGYAEVMTVLRTSLEGVAHHLAPAVAAEVDEGEVRAAIAAEIRHALEAAADGLARLAR